MSWCVLCVIVSVLAVTCLVNNRPIAGPLPISPHPHHYHPQPVQRTDWLKFASGLVTPAFWSQTMTPRNPSFSWYLDKAVGTVEEAVAGSGGERALIVGHSAGKWAR